MVDVNRIPPQSIEAEKAVLGSLLLDSNMVAPVAVILQPEDFYMESHRRIYEAIRTVSDRGEPVDIISLSEELRQNNQLEKAGGSAYITELTVEVPTAANAEYYASLVKNKSMLRQMIMTAGNIVNMGYQAEEEANVILDKAEQMIFSLAEGRTNQEVHHIKDMLYEAFERLENIYNQDGGTIGVATGFYELDNMTSGFQPSDLIIIAARPSMGKTALALNMAQHMALQNKVPVGIFSLEMSKEQLAQRLLCAEAKINGQQLRCGQVQDSDWLKLSKTLGDLSEAPIFIDDTPGITLMDLRAKARRLKAENGLGLIIIDYLQLMQGDGRAESRQQEISEISRSLKGLARELEVPVIALSQLSRAVESRPNKRPMLSDLRESGSIEQDADVVLFIYRDEYYNPESDKAGLAELIIAKQRNGPVGTAEVSFHKDITRFENKDREPG